MSFNIVELPLQGLKVIHRQVKHDHRGFLSRLFCEEELAIAGWVKPISQINHTHTSKKGTVRGLHFQLPPYMEMKLVSCIKGKIWDVVVDLRADSSTFLQWHAEELSEENKRSLLIPEGFAHGFQTLSDDVELLYCHSEPYRLEAETGLNPKDLQLSIGWPLEITEISIKDANHEMLNKNFYGMQL